MSPALSPCRPTLAGLSLVDLIAAMTGTVLLLTWRLGLGKPVRAVPPDQDGLGAA